MGDVRLGDLVVADDGNGGGLSDLLREGRGSRPAPAATQALATANTIALVIMTMLSPLLGAVADYFAVKKKMLGAFMLLGVAACAV